MPAGGEILTAGELFPGSKYSPPAGGTFTPEQSKSEQNKAPVSGSD